jgi:hypothetical protein
MKQPKIVLLIFVSGKIVLTGAKVIFVYIIIYFSFNFPPENSGSLDFMHVFYFDRWEMRPMQPLRTYTPCLLSSGKINNGMDIFYYLYIGDANCYDFNESPLFSVLTFRILILWQIFIKCRSSFLAEKWIVYKLRPRR